VPGIRRRRPPKLQHIDMQETTFENKVDLIRAKDPRYERDAYAFLREALEYTQQAIKKKRGRIRHISGQELLAGIREFALEKFGPMALMMLGEWGIHNCRDFGEIVFNMVETSGSLTFLAEDIKDVRAFTSKLKRKLDPVSRFLWEQFSDPTRQALLANKEQDGTEAILAKELSEIIRTSLLYDQQRFAGVNLSEQAKVLAGHNLRGPQLALFNRILLEDAYPEEIVKSGGLLAKTDRDSRADFENGYDFYEAFRKPFLPSSKQVKSEMTPTPASEN
jgi:uncharacterized repeat protein (TIGR04138 family)